MVHPEGVDLDLQDGRLYLAIFDQTLELFETKVADADGADEALVDERLERFPRLEVIHARRLQFTWRKARTELSLSLFISLHEFYRDIIDDIDGDWGMSNRRPEDI